MLYGIGRPKAKKPAKKPKGPPGCWFSKCTISELTEMLRAVGAPVSGNKVELVDRLHAHPIAATYGTEFRMPSFRQFAARERMMMDSYGYDSDDGVAELPSMHGNCNGRAVSDIKEECRQRGLKVTGNRYDLVLSLLRAKAAPAPAPGAAVGTAAAGGGGVAPAQVPAPTPRAPRAPSTKAAAIDSLLTRLHKKVASETGQYVFLLLL